jgi:hypothetical protein
VQSVFRFSFRKLFVGSQCWCGLWKTIKAIGVTIHKNILVFFITLLKKSYIFCYVISFQTYLSFLPIDVTADKLEAAKSVTSTYQEATCLNNSGGKYDRLLKLQLLHIVYHSHSSVNSNSVLYFMSIYGLKNGVKEQWILQTHLITFAV